MNLIPQISADVLDAARPTCAASETLEQPCFALATHVLRMTCPCGTEVWLVCAAHLDWACNEDITCPDCGFECTPTGRERI